MNNELNLKVIARIKTDFKAKFGIPRQSGLVNTKGRIIFCEEFRNREALRGIEGYSHLWLLWAFSENIKEEWSPTVRPPRLGGNKRMGVFATRSPFRPNPIGLSSVKLERIIENTPDGTVLEVSGIDLLDDTPIYDIKPYISYTDSHPDATGGFSTDVFDNNLEVIFEAETQNILPQETLLILTEILSQDPRPAYQNDENRVYSFEYSHYKIKFCVKGKKLTVTEVSDLQN